MTQERNDPHALGHNLVGDTRPIPIYPRSVRLLAVVVSLVCLAATSSAFAKPKLKVAVAPIRGDTDGTIAEAVVDALAGKDFAVKIGRAHV